PFVAQLLVCWCLNHYIWQVSIPWNTRNPTFNSHNMKKISFLALIIGFTSMQAQHTFSPTLESLRNYECPEWFQDAKFGIYVHWGVYSVPEMGEWYGREMYMEGHEVYKYHLEN